MSEPPQDAVPRPLTERERSVVEAMLSVSFDGVEALRRQVPSLLVSGRCGCGCPTIYFAHPKDEVGVWQRVNASITGTHDGLMLFTSGQWLDSLEYVGTGERDPAEFPDPGLLVVEPCS